MTNREAVIQNSAGIHVRPSGIILAEADKYKGEIRINANSVETNLKSVIGLLSMGLAQGDNVAISVSGPDEVSMCDKLVDLFEYQYDFPSNE